METSIIAQRIRYYRKQKKLTQEELADRVGVSDTYIRKLEAGERNPSLQAIMKIATALDTTPDHLLLQVAKITKSDQPSLRELLSDCSPTEYIILYECMARLKALLRKYL